MTRKPRWKRLLTINIPDSAIFGMMDSTGRRLRNDALLNSGIVIDEESTIIQISKIFPDSDSIQVIVLARTKS